MLPRNTPRGNKEDELSSFHQNSPPQELLRMYFDEEKSENILPLHPILKKIFNNLENKRVLDIGCGIGSIFCKALLFYGLNPNNLYSLDLDPKNFEKDEYPRKNKIVGSAENLNFPENFFDIVHSNEMTLDNSEINYFQVLKEVHKVLKSGGIYIANEYFDIVEEKRETNPELDKSCPKILKIIDNFLTLDKIGFKSLVRIKYAESAKTSKNQFVFYAFVKK